MYVEQLELLTKNYVLGLVSKGLEKDGYTNVGGHMINALNSKLSDLNEFISSKEMVKIIELNDVVKGYDMQLYNGVIGLCHSTKDMEDLEGNYPDESEFDVTATYDMVEGVLSYEYNGAEVYFYDTKVIDIHTFVNEFIDLFNTKEEAEAGEESGTIVYFYDEMMSGAEMYERLHKVGEYSE